MKDVAAEWPAGHFSQVESIHSNYVGNPDVFVATVKPLLDGIGEEGGTYNRRLTDASALLARHTGAAVGGDGYPGPCWCSNSSSSLRVRRRAARLPFR